MQFLRLQSLKTSLFASPEASVSPLRCCLRLMLSLFNRFVDILLPGRGACCFPFECYLAMFQILYLLFSGSISCHVFHDDNAISIEFLTQILKGPFFHSLANFTFTSYIYQLMDSSTSTPDKGTWSPGWVREPAVEYQLRPYSTAAKVSQGSRPQPEIWDICNGCILWLPTKDVVNKLLDPRLSSHSPSFFDHPVLILDIQVSGPWDAIVRFANIRSLHRPSLRGITSDHYLPIFPTEPHPNSGALLRLEKDRHNRRIIKNSYVSISDGIFSIDFKALQCYAIGQKADGYRHRLNKESFEQVTRELGFHSSAWIETSSLWETFLNKHVPTETEEAVPAEVKDGSA